MSPKFASFLFSFLLVFVFASPINAQTDSPSPSPSPTASPSVSPSPSATASASPNLGGPADKDKVLGASTKLGETGTEIQIAKWVFALILGFGVLFAGFRLVRSNDQE